LTQIVIADVDLLIVEFEYELLLGFDSGGMSIVEQAQPLLDYFQGLQNAREQTVHHTRIRLYVPFIVFRQGVIGLEVAQQRQLLLPQSLCLLPQHAQVDLHVDLFVVALRDIAQPEVHVFLPAEQLHVTIEFVEGAGLLRGLFGGEERKAV